MCVCVCVYYKLLCAYMYNDLWKSPDARWQRDKSSGCIRTYVISLQVPHNIGYYVSPPVYNSIYLYRRCIGGDWQKFVWICGLFYLYVLKVLTAGYVGEKKTKSNQNKFVKEGVVCRVPYSVLRCTVRGKRTAIMCRKW